MHERWKKIEIEFFFSSWLELYVTSITKDCVFAGKSMFSWLALISAKPRFFD